MSIIKRFQAGAWLAVVVSFVLSNKLDAQNTVKTAGWNDPTASMFHRPTKGPDTHPSDDLGMLKIQVDSLTKHPEFVNILPMIDTQVVPKIAVFLQSAEQPVFHLKDLETIVCGISYSVSFQPGRKNPGRLFFGVSDCTVELAKPVDLSWISRNSKSAKLIDGGPEKIYQLTEPGAFGPGPLMIASRDDRTICLANVMSQELNSVQDADDLRKTLKYSATNNTSPWADAFRKVDGGLVTIAIPTENFDLRAFNGLGAGPNRAIKRVASRAKTFSIGLDWDKDSMLGLRLRMDADDAKSAKLMLNDLQMILKDAKRSIDEGEIAATGLTAKLSKVMLDSMVMRQDDQADGTSAVDIRAAAPMTMADVLGPFIFP